MDNEKLLQDAFDSFMDLKDGWLDGFGRAPDITYLVWVKRIMYRCIVLGAPRAYLYPTPEGNIVAEWTIGLFEISALFATDNKSIKISASNRNNDDYEEDVIIGESEINLAEKLTSLLNLF